MLCEEELTKDKNLIKDKNSMKDKNSIEDLSFDDLLNNIIVYKF